MTQTYDMTPASEGEYPAERYGAGWVNPDSGPPGSAQSGSLPAGSGPVYVQDTEPDRGAFPWLWYDTGTGDLTAYDGSDVAPSPTAPAFTASPVVSGSTTAGSTLTRTLGTVTGYPTPTRTTRWRKDGVAISGETGATYVTQEGDVDSAIDVLVTADNDVEPNATADSNNITVTASGGGGGWTPASVAGLQAWYKPETLSGLSNADAITTWPDSSGHSRALTPAGNPTYRTALAGALAGVRLDGAGDYLVHDAVSAFITTNTLTFFAICIRRAVVFSTGLASLMADGDPHSYGSVTSALVGYVAGDGTAQSSYRNNVEVAKISSPANPANGQVFIIMSSFEADGGSRMKRIESGSTDDASSSGGSTSNFAIDAIYLGGMYTASAMGPVLQYDVIEAGLYSTDVTGSDETALVDYLTTRAGL